MVLFGLIGNGLDFPADPKEALRILRGKIATLHTQTDAAPAADIAALQAQCDALSARTDVLQSQMKKGPKIMSIISLSSP